MSTNRSSKRLGAFLVAAIVTFGIFSSQMANATDTKANSVSYSVQPGDTLWAIASSQAPQADTREYIAQLVELNQLTSATLTPGQEIFLPNR